MKFQFYLSRLTCNIDFHQCFLFITLRYFSRSSRNYRRFLCRFFCRTLFHIFSAKYRTIQSDQKKNAMLLINNQYWPSSWFFFSFLSFSLFYFSNSTSSWEYLSCKYLDNSFSALVSLVAFVTHCQLDLRSIEEKKRTQWPITDLHMDHLLKIKRR